jgi:site-specific recombinase XerD
MRHGRHTFASRLVMAGVDLYAVKVLLGHNSIEMTERHAYLDPNYLRQAIGALVPRQQVTPELTPANISA